MQKPSKVVCAGLNYIDHAKELNMAIPKEPIIFLKPSSSVIYDGDTIILPSSSGKVDYEAELAIVISKECRNIKPENYMDYVKGFCCLNDVTARDLQKQDGQWTRAKSFDTFCPVGKKIIKDIDPDNVKIQSFVNNELKQDSNTSNFIFKTAELLSFISGIMTLYPGDIIATGTPPGIGQLKHNDTVEIRIEGIGSLINFVKNDK